MTYQCVSVKLRKHHAVSNDAYRTSGRFTPGKLAFEGQESQNEHNVQPLALAHRLMANLKILTSWINNSKRCDVALETGCKAVS